MSKPKAEVVMREYLTLASGGSGIFTSPISALGFFPWLKNVVTNNYDIIKYRKFRIRLVLYSVAPSAISPAGLIYGFSVGQTAPLSINQLPDAQETNFITSRPWCNFDISALETNTYDTATSIGFFIWGRSDGVAILPTAITFEVEYMVTLKSPS
jgi:hypothetical protein